MSTRRPNGKLLAIRAVVVIAVLVFLYITQWRNKDQEKAPGKVPPAAPAGEIVIENETAQDVVVRNEDGDVIYSGDVDLSQTIDRIETGNELTWHENDGEVFGNFEKRLPKKDRGYYREWVHPTPGLRGAGPQRIITGRAGEKYYSPDHYGHFYLVP